MFDVGWVAVTHLGTQPAPWVSLFKLGRIAAQFFVGLGVLKCGLCSPYKTGL